MRLATVLLFLACVSGALMARAAVPESPRPRLIGIADGLPSSNVNGLAQDRAGYLWLATSDGLARYDGVEVRVWRHVPGDAASLPGNYITAVHVEDGERVWVAIEGRGMSVLDAAQSGFRHYRQASHGQVGSDDVWAMASHDGRLWFGTFGGGLHRLDGMAPDGTERITRFMPQDGDARSLPSETVLSLRVDARNQLWVGTTHGLARWTGSDFERIALPGDLPAATVFSITPDGDALWVGAKSGLFRYGADGQWTRPEWSTMFAWPNAVFDIVADRGGHWLASHRNLWRVTPDATPRPLAIGEHGPVRPMFQMLRQANGALWFPVSGVGVGYLHPDWRRIAEASRDQGTLASELIRGVTPAAQGGVWLAGHRGEIERLDSDGGSLAVSRQVQARMKGRRPIAVVEDQNGRLWLGERDALVRIDRAGRFLEWPADSPTDAPPGGPIDLMRVARDGTLWLSASGAGIQQRDIGSGRVLTRIEPGDVHGLGVGDIEAIELAPDDSLWVAGATGLARWDPRAQRLQPVPGLSVGDRVFGFAFDGSEALWLQRLSGLEHYRRIGSTWHLQDRVGLAEGIPAVEGSGLRVDRRHRVWLASLRGLFRWDPTRRHVRRFGLHDGLSSQEFSDHAMTLTDAGVLVAALADGGVVQVDTLAADLLPTRPGLFLDRLEVRRSGQWHALDLAAPELTANDRELRVQLRLLAYENPQANRYFTRLEGYDAQWVAQGASGERVFAGLEPGQYTLRGRAIDAAGNPAEERVVRFRVQAPWWRTPWAMAGFFGIAVLLSWWSADGYRQRLRRGRSWQRHKYERELADQASLAKTHFLATLGHEVRTPMTGVLGMSELLLGTALDHTQRGYTESIRGAGEHLLRLMDDALDLARIEAGKLQLVDEAFALRPLLAEVVALMAPLAQRRGLGFRCEFADDLPAALRGDARRLRQILLNLLGNAIKFTERGQVSLSVRCQPPRLGPAPWVGRPSGDEVALEPTAMADIYLDVVDTGPGLDAEQLRGLFRRFEQADGARTAARYGGSGLGLAICQELAVAMRGAVTVDSTPGVGTRFSVWLPLPCVASLLAKSPACPRVPSRPRPLRLLLVEDNPTVAEVIAGLLRAQGHHVTHVEHALAGLTEGATGRFDAALLDLDIPGLHGFELARQLRGQGFAAPVIALTARADPEAETLALRAGFDRFIRKPVSGAMLAELLEVACSHTGGERDVGRASAVVEAG